jgi:hypothetical protein
MNLSIEDIKTIYFDADAIRLPDYRLGRLQFGDGRLYYRYGHQEADAVELFNSLTTVIYQCTPMPFSLLEWYCRYGMTEAKRISDTAAKYGTLMHIEIGRFCETQEYDFDKTEAVVEAYLSKINFWQPECKLWGWKLKQDMIAWAQFVHDTKLKCIAVEMVLCSSKGFATAIDVVADMDLPVKGEWGEVYASGTRKGQPKVTSKNVRKRVLINMKSGRHGFYPNNGLQVAAEKILFEENFPDIKIDAFLNWAPTDWESVDGDKYKFKDWTDSIDMREIDCMFSLAEVKFRDKMQNKDRLNIWGQLVYGNSPGTNISIQKLVDMVKAIELKKKDPDVSLEEAELTMVSFDEENQAIIAERPQ